MGMGSREINVEDPQETKNRILGGSSYATLGYICKGKKPACKTDTWMSIFIVALFTIVKLKNQPKCPSTGV